MILLGNLKSFLFRRYVVALVRLNFLCVGALLVFI